MTALLALLRRDLRLALRQGADTLVVVFFFVLTVSLFPFGVGPEPQILARIASGVIWVTALLASLLSLERLFQTDYEDGSLDLLLLAPVGLEGTVLAKCLAHWLTTGVPLILATPIWRSSSISRPTACRFSSSPCCSARPRSRCSVPSAPPSCSARGAAAC